ncbi:MAG TPA: hypothetical protein VKU44_03085 [Terriglobia bacterium]|nr:hypothetical protein [Terriglobia bacterium]
MRHPRMIVSIVLSAAVSGMLAALLFAADITGKWSGEPDQGPAFVFNFKSDGAKLTGTMQGREGKDHAIKDGKIEGDAISFSVESEWQGNPITLVMKGKIAGDAIQLRIDTQDRAWGTDVALKRAAAAGK